MAARRGRVGIVGRVDPEGTLCDGQTVKTRAMWRGLVARYGEDGVCVVDTRDRARRPLAVLARLARCLASCDVVVAMLSRGGRRALFPLLARAARVRGTRVLHCLVGGALADDVRADPRLVRTLNAFEAHWVETRALADELAALGVRGVSCMPNFRELPVVDEGSLAAPVRDPLLFCTYGRVCAAKGVGAAAEAVARLDASGVPCRLDVWGPVDGSWQASFDELLARHPRVRYRGCAGPDEGARVVGAYAALLFPTTWRGEGVPGSVIDALAAGVPVLARRWRYHDEMLEDGVTGWSCGPDEDFSAVLARFAGMGDAELVAMRRGCLRRSRRYAAQTAWERVWRAIEGGEVGR